MREITLAILITICLLSGLLLRYGAIASVVPADKKRKLVGCYVAALLIHAIAVAFLFCKDGPSVAVAKNSGVLFAMVTTGINILCTAVACDFFSDAQTVEEHRGAVFIHRQRKLLGYDVDDSYCVVRNAASCIPWCQDSKQFYVYFRWYSLCCDYDSAVFKNCCGSKRNGGKAIDGESIGRTKTLLRKASGKD